MKTQLLKSISSLLFLAFATSISVAQTAEKPNGSGTESDPYAIATLNNLYWLSQATDEWDKYYRQTADIDASATSDWDDGAGFKSIGESGQSLDEKKFYGSYDGQYFTIDKLYINRPERYNVGLFRTLRDATISNLGLTNINITATQIVGALAGEIEFNSTITNCYSTGVINITGNNGGGNVVGGLVGRTTSANEDSPNSISYCYSDVTVNGLKNESQFVGGLIGSLSSYNIIKNCYSRGSVTGNSSTGGLVGIAGEYISFYSAITNCYSTGKVITPNDPESKVMGGLIGEVRDQTTVNNSFWDVETSSKSYSSGGTGKTTSEMKRMGTFTSAGWDFESETTNGLDNVWDMDMSGVVNDGYPYLWWQDGDGTSLDVLDAPVLPDGFVIHQNYPNPFNPTTTISYDLPKRSLVTIGIFNLLGKQIKTLVNQSQDAGNKIAVWNGTDDLGRPVSAGVYLYQIQAGEFNQTRKMLLLK